MVLELARRCGINRATAWRLQRRASSSTVGGVVLAATAFSSTIARSTA